MRIALFGKTISEGDAPYIQRLLNKLEKVEAEMVVYEPFFKNISPFVEFNKGGAIFNSHHDIRDNIDFLFSIGGDGTFLETLNLVRDSGIPIMGINIGRLGFLSSISKDEINYSIDALYNDMFNIEKRALLKVTKPDDLFGELNYALNEFTLSRKESTSLIVIHVYVDDTFVNSYWADGLIVSTPTGSTAYSLSSGGPIVSPGSENFLITPIATHNLTVRPIVIRDDSVIRIKAEGRDRNFFVSLDSRFKTIDKAQELIVEKGDFDINLVQMNNKDFFTTIRDKLNWGLDRRN